jgi:site-specific DNA recombinase
VPALIDESLFTAVQEQLAANQQQARERRRGAKYLLQGLLECGCCRYAFYGKPVSRTSAKGKTRHTYYRCVGTDGYRFGGERVCTNQQVRTDQLDEAVWQDVRALLRHPELLRAEYERRLQTTGDEAQREPLTRQLRHAERAVSRLIDAFQDGLIEKPEFTPRLAKVRERVTRLRDDLTRLTAADAARDQLRRALSCLDEFAARIGAGLDEADWSVRRQIIRTLVERIRIEPDQIRITYRLSVPLFASSPPASSERI